MQGSDLGHEAVVGLCLLLLPLAHCHGVLVEGAGLGIALVAGSEDAANLRSQQQQGQGR